MCIRDSIDGLEDVIALLKGSIEPVILHTDQGSVYASMAYNDVIRDTNIIRSMSRAGKPTYNPVNEALNGWINEELYAEFKIELCLSLIHILPGSLFPARQARKRPGIRKDEASHP